jgi:uncharacterized protein (TIRG00374 family)
MTKKRILILAVILGVLGVLIYLQFRTWQAFDWSKFTENTASLWRGAGLVHILGAMALIYSTYWLRALRWKLFLKPVRDARMASLVPTQFIGFTGLALLGRLGELIRPYLIAKKENLTMSSQLAVWAVERIFDIGAFAVLICINVFFFGRQLPYPQYLHKAAAVLMVLVAGMGLGAYFVRRNSNAVAAWMERRSSAISERLGAVLSSKIRSFGEGLNTIHDASTFLQLTAVSLLIWLVISLSYCLVLHAYSQPVLQGMNIPQVLLLMASSMLGSLVQLPAVGGGSQLMVIKVLSSPKLFAVPPELAVSAGMLLWLVTFMSVIPVGLALSRHEHLSIRKLTEETAGQEELAVSSK